MKKLFTVNLLLLFIIQGFTQNTFKEAYYITIDLDTVSGYIRDDDWLKNPNYFNFKKRLNEKSEKVTP